MILATLLAGASCGCNETATTDNNPMTQIDETCKSLRLKYPDMPQVTADELKAAGPDDKHVLVDAREPDEQAVSMIVGAITKDAYEAAGAKYDGARVIVYCTVGGRASKYADSLQKRGVDVANLEGGILLWTHAGGDLADAAGATKRVHVAAAQWALAAEGYECVW